MDIKLIIEKLGFKITPHEVAGKDHFEFYCIKNNDGSVRWLWPTSLKEPLFLKFYHTGTLRAKAFALAVRLIFRARLCKRFFDRISMYGMQASNYVVPDNGIWALFTGTQGPNRKAIVVTREDKQVSFIKIGLGKESHSLIQNEVASLEFLSNLGVKRFSYPSLKGVSSEIVELNELPGKEGINSFTRLHEIALRELKDKTYYRTELSDAPFWKEARKKLESLVKSNDVRISRGLIRKLQLCISLIDEKQLINTNLAHGDFTPWNTRVGSNCLSVFDWELSRREMPAGFDAFHFIIQGSILIDRLPWKEIVSKLDPIFEKKAIMGGYNREAQQLYLSLYLITNTIYYLDIYNRQQVWHEQISWLIETWNDALNFVLKDKTSHRSLLASDLMQALGSHQYAILKDKGERPEDIGLYSDVDIAITRGSYNKISKFLEKHSLVVRRVVSLRSNMASQRIFLRDGSLLCMDFIWKMKRKGIQFMNISSILSNSIMNQHGIRTASPIDDARFVAYFYALNNASVPDQYKKLSAILKTSDKPIDDLLANHIDGDFQSLIKILISERPENRGLSGMMNKINYLLDSLKMITRTRGMVITFSGVDGAGKSTIIDQLKNRLEKQLRKRVVVLRHRPSMLPILSAWTKGKAKAESDAALRLPRQGKNKSKLSSVGRFMYYYLDYVLGQFYIHVRYVWRDYVVLYDRYYFDFISDSKRSNIDLSPSIAQLGYRFIMKPAYNFFLYASPEIILSRKQELDRNTIVSLTSNYLQLFKKLGTSSTARYIPIENKEAGQTLGTIFEYIAKAS